MSVLDKQVLHPEIHAEQGIAAMKSEQKYKQHLLSMQHEIDLILQRLYHELVQNESINGIIQLRELLRVSSQGQLKGMVKSAQDFISCL